MPHSPVMTLLRHFSLGEWRHHTVRHATAVLAVMLGVALAFSVHLINQSALSEFSAAVRSVNGQADFELRRLQGSFDEALYGRVATHPLVAQASPVVEVSTYAQHAGGQRVPLRLLGLDALAAGPISPAVLPRLDPGQDRLDLFATDAVSLNAAARARLGVQAGDTLLLQAGLDWVRLRVVGSVGATDAPLAVMDIAGAQEHFQRLGLLSRIDVRLVPGAKREEVLSALGLPPDVRAVTPDEGMQRISNVSKAYRVNLTVLALVALFTGAFLVFSVLSLSVAKRQQQLALLGVLGLTSAERMRLVLWESAALGLLGSALGLLLGTGLAALALRLLSGDLGGGYFPGIAPRLQGSWSGAALYGGLGVLAALAGGWLPARHAGRLQPAQALKGLGDQAQGGPAVQGLGIGLLVLGVLLAMLPPLAGLPLFAYLSVASLLLGGIACVPLGVGLLLRLLQPARRLQQDPQILLALERARRMRHTATVAVAGVVASLSLAVALTVMVASFRASVTQWLDTVLPADLYARAATPGGLAEAAYLPPAFIDAAASVPGVLRAEALRVQSLLLDPARPAVALIVQPLADPARSLPLVSELHPARSGHPGAYVSEAMVDLYGARPGTLLKLPVGPPPGIEVMVRGVWRDYVRQHGAVALDQAEMRALEGDGRANDLALWLDESADAAQVQARLRTLAEDPSLLEFALPREIRAASLRIFDRSFAVTYWLQAVAIAIGLFGIAASFSAQVLARRKEFGLLRHLGFTRRQVLAVVAGEGAAWTGLGALIGLALGLAVSVVLVHVVNPQSFHWTMDLLLPWGRLALLAAAVVVAGTATAWVAGRAAASREAVLAVKEDW